MSPKPTLASGWMHLAIKLESGLRLKDFKTEDGFDINFPQQMPNHVILSDYSTRSSYQFPKELPKIYPVVCLIMADSC